MFHLIQDIRAILDDSCPRHLFIPRGTLLFLALLTAGLHFAAFFLFWGIWIIISVVLFFVSSLFLYLYYQVWKKYYAGAAFFLVVVIELFCMDGAAQLAQHGFEMLLS